MTVQARAEATHQRIVDGAVDLFDEVGYGNSSLSDIIDRAGVTKGAFYYHFSSKESVAAAIIQQAMTKKEDAVLALISSPSAALESLIRATFVVNDMTEHDKLVRSGHQLRQGLTHISSYAAMTYIEHPLVRVSTVEKAIAEGDLSDDLDADAATHTLQASVLGTRLLSDATGDDIFAGLVQLWSIFLRGLVPPQSASYFQQLLTRLAQHYTQPK
jgi:AcrR family transcriptional regulator